ncbi:MAG: hypothetical protein NC131_18770 [Roseburia sp.]|nr:hypothetical protein [Roseburia sp.]
MKEKIPTYEVKVYMYETAATMFIAIIAPIVIAGAIVLSVFIPSTMIITIPFILCYLILYIVAIVTGHFTPIHLNDKGLEYKKRFISWEDVKITAVPLRSSLRHCYFLVFDTQYLYGEDAIKQYRRGFCVYVKKNSLNLFLNYYKAKLMVLDTDLEKEVLPYSTKAINEIINNYNKQF